MRLAFPNHPYGTPLEGSEESVSALTRDDLIAAHRSAYARDRVFVGATGDITPEELGEVLDTLLGGLPENGAPLPERAEFALAGGVTVVPYETPQSVVRFGHRGIKRDDPDFFPAYILNEILGGGGFGSRLTEEVRVKRGLTYGVYSYLAPKDHAALYLGSVSSANDRIAEAVEDLDIALLIIGSKGHNGLLSRLLGGTATRVIRSTPCSLLVVEQIALFADA